MASTNFTSLPRKLATATINFSSVSLKVLLVSSVPTETNFDTWVNRSDITNEITGTGYTAGGVAQAYTLDALDTTNNQQTITPTSNASAWPSATFSAAGAIIYVTTGTASTDTLIGFIDFGSTQSVSSGTFGITYTTPLAISR